jgi:hypothetical protein
MAKGALTKVPVFDKGQLTTEQLKRDTDDRFAKNEILIYSVLVVVAVTLVATLIGAAALIVDQMHFNNELYRDDHYVHTKTITKTEIVHDKPTQITLPSITSQP